MSNQPQPRAGCDSWESWESELREEVLACLVDFFISTFHTIMNRSGYYDPVSFISTNMFEDVNVKMSVRPAAAEYIQDITKKLLCLLITNQLEGVEILLMENSDVRERYILDSFGKFAIDSIFGENYDQTESKMSIDMMKLGLGKALTELMGLLPSRPFSQSSQRVAEMQINLAISEKCFHSQDQIFQDWKKTAQHPCKQGVKESKLSTISINIGKEKLEFNLIVLTPTVQSTAV